MDEWELGALAFMDELLPLEGGDGEATSAGAGAARVSPVEPLSADEVDELLRAIESEHGDSARAALQVEELHALPSVATAPQQRPPHVESIAAFDVGNSVVLKKKKSKKAVSNSNKARDGRKEELVYLRKTVSELETRLVLLQSNKKSARSASSVSADAATIGIWADEASASAPARSRSYLSQEAGGDSVISVQDTKPADVWKEIARRQGDERDRSERENIRLRLVLESQLKVARSLERFLMLKAASSTTDIAKSIAMHRHFPHQESALERLISTDQLTDAAIFRELLVGVEESLAEVDAVYKMNGLASCQERSQISAQMRLDPTSGGLLVEVCATKVLPFGIHETGAAVWNHYLFAKQRMPSRYYSYHSHKSMDTTDDTIVEDFTLELHGKHDTRASFRMRQIMRRLVDVDAERIVIVWRSFFDPLQFSEQPLSDVRFLEKGYIVIRKSPTPGSESILLQPCYIISPFSAPGAMGDTVGAITDFLLGTTAANVAATHQMIENVLLEQTLRRKRGQ